LHATRGGFLFGYKKTGFYKNLASSYTWNSINNKPNKIYKKLFEKYFI